MESFKDAFYAIWNNDSNNELRDIIGLYGNTTYSKILVDNQHKISKIINDNYILFANIDTDPSGYWYYADNNKFYDMRFMIIRYISLYNICGNFQNRDMLNMLAIDKTNIGILINSSDYPDDEKYMDEIVEYDENGIGLSQADIDIYNTIYASLGMAISDP